MDDTLFDENKKNEIINSSCENNKNEVINNSDERTDAGSLNPENLEEISGGYIYHNRTRERNDDRPWEVIDKKGNVIERFSTKQSCIDSATRTFKQSPKKLNWYQLNYLRTTKSNKPSRLTRYLALKSFDNLR